MRVLIAFILFAFPSFFSKSLVTLIGGKKHYSFGKHSKIRFSFIFAREIHMNDNSVILSGNLIIVEKLVMGEESRIKRLNILKGKFNVILDKLGVINQANKITSRMDIDTITTLKIGYNAIVGVMHLLDMTEDITLGDNSILAGVGSQLWTHGFIHDDIGKGRTMITGPIMIGHNVYVGSHVIFNKGVSIVPTAVIGAGCVVSKSITEVGLYVNQPLRLIKKSK